MPFVSESQEEKQEVLIIENKESRITSLLKEHLKKYNTEIFVSPIPPQVLNRFHLVFVIGDKNFKPYFAKGAKKLVFIYVDQKNIVDKLKTEIEQKNYSKAKLVALKNSALEEKDIDRILWFAFSASKETLISIENLKTETQKQIWIPKINLKPLINPKNIVLLLIGLVLFVHLAFIPFLATSTYFYAKSASYLKNENTDRAQANLFLAKRFNNFAAFTYGFARPGLLLFSLALFPDNIFDIDERAQSVLQESLDAYQNGKSILRLIFQKDKTTQEKKELLTRLDKLSQEADLIENELTVLTQKLPDSPRKIKTAKDDISDMLEFIGKTKPILPKLKDILADGGEKKYLLLFANNMELRPGGGFIGSFGVLNAKDLTISDIQVYDVYDADGQLTTHIDPPAPISKYLKQPHWFLRDSAFSSDFFENYNQAKIFLDKELSLGDFSGGMLITTSAIQNLLEAFGNIYLPDFNESINKDNFYIKTQLYSEKQFFPGSIQKKSFLGYLTRQLLINLDSAPPQKLIQALRKSFDEKQIVANFEDSQVQKIFDSLYWAGKTILPRCSTEQSCVLDYVFVVDANLGVNKANFFVTRNLSQQIRIAKDGQVNNSLVVKIKNESLADIFPGGTYKNYLQVYLPRDAQVSKITKDDVLVEEYDEKVAEFKGVGFYFEVLSQKSVEVKVEYTLAQKIPSGTSAHQLIFQKQIGAKNSDFTLEILLPNNISLLSQNFSPIVKGSRIFYNTNLNTDKIFLMQFAKN